MSSFSSPASLSAAISLSSSRFSSSSLRTYSSPANVSCVGKVAVEVCSSHDLSSVACVWCVRENMNVGYDQSRCDLDIPLLSLVSSCLVPIDLRLQLLYGLLKAIHCGLKFPWDNISDLGIPSHVSTNFAMGAACSLDAIIFSCSSFRNS